jgi:carbon monoxide dehydrogenase subunit G
MARVEVNRDAPAVGSAEASIDAPIEVVWRILSDLEKWPAWNKGVTKIRVNGGIKAGTTFDWTAGRISIVSRLEEVAPPARIAWTGKMLGIRAIHVWELEVDGRGTRVHTEESFEGWLAKLFPAAMKRALAKALDQGVRALKVAAESRRG